MTEFWLPESRKNYFLTKDYRYQVSIGSSSDIDLLLEREKNYKQAIENANKAGEGSKARRYGRGLKVRLQFAAILILVQQSIFEISSVLLRLLQNLLRLHVLHKLNAMKFFQKQNNSLNNTANCHSSAKSRWLKIWRINIFLVQLFL